MFLIDFLATVSWVVVLVAVVTVFLVGLLLEEEQPVAATGAVIAAVAVLGATVYSADQMFEFVKAIPQHIGWVVIYLTVGLFWSLAKWGFYVRRMAIDLAKRLESVKNLWCSPKHREEFISNRRQRNWGTDEAIANEYANRHREDLVSAINRALFKAIGRSVTESDISSTDVTVESIFKSLKVTPSNSKALISAWIAYWPMSMAITGCKELLINLIENIIQSCQGVYNMITKAMIGNALNDAFAQAEEINKRAAVAKAE